MECVDDFDAHLNQKLRDPRRAAGFLAACLHDSVKENDPNHFFHAVDEIAKAMKIKREKVRLVLHAYIDHDPNFTENLGILIFRLSPSESNLPTHA